jgi:hypothetical protein
MARAGWKEVLSFAWRATMNRMKVEPLMVHRGRAAGTAKIAHFLEATVLVYSLTGNSKYNCELFQQVAASTGNPEWKSFQGQGAKLACSGDNRGTA